MTTLILKKGLQSVLHIVLCYVLTFTFFYITDKHYSQRRPRNWARSLWRRASNAGHKSYWLCCGRNMHGNAFWGIILSSDNVLININCRILLMFLSRNVKIYFIHWSFTHSLKNFIYAKRSYIFSNIFFPFRGDFWKFTKKFKIYSHKDTSIQISILKRCLRSY